MPKPKPLINKAKEFAAKKQASGAAKLPKSQPAKKKSKKG